MRRLQVNRFQLRHSSAALLSLLLGAASAACGAASTSAPEDINVVLTHTAGGGAFADLGGGTARLTLHGVGASTGYSAEQPVPASGVTSTKAVLDEYEWDPANPPTAAVAVTDATATSNQNVILVSLMNPSYDKTLATLSFDVQLATNYRGQNLARYVADADSSLPPSFGQTTVVIDSWWHHSCSRGYIQCYLHYGCCSQPFVTHPLGNMKVDRCWSWSQLSCQPCSDDPCKSGFPNECGSGNCYASCMGASECNPT